MTEIKQVERLFYFNQGGTNHTLPDPNPEMTPHEVKKFYAARFPDLINANIEGPRTKNDRLEFTFTGNIGVKG
jgi:PRTRC genetic system protein C